MHLEYPHNAAAEQAETDACTQAHRLYSQVETRQQAAVERDRVDALLDGWNNGARPAHRRYRTLKQARALAAQMREPTTGDVWGERKGA